MCVPSNRRASPRKHGFRDAITRARAFTGSLSVCPDKRTVFRNAFTENHFAGLFAERWLILFVMFARCRDREPQRGGGGAQQRSRLWRPALETDFQNIARSRAKPVKIPPLRTRTICIRINNVARAACPFSRGSFWYLPFSPASSAHTSVPTAAILPVKS